MKKPLLLSLLIASLLLNACATHTISEQEITALSLHDRRTRDDIINDINIETDINEDLKDEQELFSQSHININVFNGRVLVTGETPDQETREQIITILRVVKYVKQVHDNLAIGYPSDNATRSNDAALREQLTAALGQIRTIPDFDSSMVKVIVEHASVYLMGLVHRTEGEVVINVIRHQPGVNQITTIFEYLD
ncbi:MAG: BON domain-containing protein [Methylococcaceae bacterium]